MPTYSLPRRAVLMGAAALLAAPHAAFAQTNDALARAVTQLFDPADGRAARARFVQAHVSEAARERWAQPRFVETLEAMTAASGGLDFISARAEQPTSLRITTRTRRQGVTRALIVIMDRDNTDKVFSLLTIPLPTAYDRPGPRSHASLAELERAIDARFRFAVERDEFSGAVRIAAPDGAAIYENAFGFADRERAIANTPETRFHLGSSDKSFTALMIARLVAEGRLSYAARVADVLPQYPNVEFARACTVQNLLTHASGLGGLFERPQYDGRQRIARMADLFPVFAAEPTAFAPGARARYSNEGFIVLGAIIEAVTRRDWYDLLSEQIYAPAGMTRSAHFTREQTADDIAIGYRYLNEDHLGLDGRHSNADVLGWRGNSCGGGYSTVRDMTRYLQSLRAGRLLAPPALAPMTVQAEPGLRNYGMGFAVNAHGARRVVGHGGGGAHSGIEGDHGVVWETGWSFSILGNYDAPAATHISRDIASWLAAM